MELFDFLNRQTINRAIIDLEMNKARTFAFLTFRSYEDASQFLIFNCIIFEGVQLQIQRPVNFRPLPGQPDDSQLFMDCNIPVQALLRNQIVREPPGANNSLQLLWKSVRTRVSEEVMLEFINSQLLGTPCQKRVIPESRAKDQRNVFLRFRCVEETTNALEMLHGEIFQGAIIKLTRPNGYVAPPGNDSAMYIRSSPKKRPSDTMLYTDPEKFSRLKDGPDSGFRGGEMGFVAPGAMERFRNQPPEEERVVNAPPERLPPSIPLPEPPAALKMLRQAKSIIENETIVTDEEVALAGHVSSMLSRVIYEYETQRYQPGPYIPPNMALSQDPDMEELLEYMAKSLEYLHLELQEEWRLACDIRHILKNEVNKYQDRIQVDSHRFRTPSTINPVPPPPPPTATTNMYTGGRGYSTYRF